VDFPLMDANMFTLGASEKVTGSQNELLAQGPAQGAADDIAAAVLRVTNALYRAIRQEAIISTCVLIIWFIILFIGIARALVLMSKGGSEGTYRQPQPQDPSNQGHEKPNSTISSAAVAFRLTSRLLPLQTRKTIPAINTMASLTRLHQTHCQHSRCTAPPRRTCQMMHSLRPSQRNSAMLEVKAWMLPSAVQPTFAPQVTATTTSHHLPRHQTYQVKPLVRTRHPPTSPHAIPSLTPAVEIWKSCARSQSHI